MVTRRQFITKAGKLTLGAAAVGMGISGATRVQAFDPMTGTYAVRSPYSPTRFISSPQVFHDQCAAVIYFDSLDFDNGVCGSAIGGDWACDAAGFAGESVYLDIQPVGISNNPVGDPFRITHGGSGNFSGWGNTQWQKFWIEVYKNGVWTKHSWVSYGHCDQWVYAPNVGSVLAYSAAPYHRVTLHIAKVASPGYYDQHTHVEVRNQINYAPSYRWDGPVTQQDSSQYPECSRAGGNSVDCNPKIQSHEVMGFAGGVQGWGVEYNNAYFPDF